MQRGAAAEKADAESLRPSQKDKALQAVIDPKRSLTSNPHRWMACVKLKNRWLHKLF